MNKLDFEAKLASIPEVEPDKDDKELLELAGRDYNGKILLRLPKTLHRELASNAKSEGISLNQFLLYKLSR
jgi:Uncharacterized protein encoded in hypervariable junctions of pilus gene clusters